MSTTTKKLPTYKGSNLDRWVVLVDGREVGIVEKHRAGRQTLHPYRVFQGIGLSSRLAGFIFDEVEATTKKLPLMKDDKIGGFQAAVALAAGQA